MVPPHMTRNVTQNTRSSFASQGGSGNETRLFNQKSLVAHTIVATVLLVGKQLMEQTHFKTMPQVSRVWAHCQSKQWWSYWNVLMLKLWTMLRLWTF